MIVASLSVIWLLQLISLHNQPQLWCRGSRPRQPALSSAELFVCPRSHLYYDNQIMTVPLVATVGIPALVAGWGWIDQSTTICSVAMNTANEQELSLFEHGLRDDVNFRQLTFQWQRLYDSCCCCGRPKYKLAARRLRIATRRVVEEGLQLPPFGSPLIDGDDDPTPAHTPFAQRDRYEQESLLEHPDFQRSPLIQRLRRQLGLGEYVPPQNGPLNRAASRVPSRAPSHRSVPLSTCMPRFDQSEQESAGGTQPASRRSGRSRVPGVPSPSGGDRGPGGPAGGVESPPGGDQGPGGPGDIVAEVGGHTNGHANSTSRSRGGVAGGRAGTSGAGASRTGTTQGVPLWAVPLRPVASPSPSGAGPSTLNEGTLSQLDPVIPDPVTSASDWAAHTGPFHAGASGQRPLGPELDSSRSLAIEPSVEMAMKGKPLGRNSPTTHSELPVSTKSSTVRSAFEEAARERSPSVELRPPELPPAGASASDLVGWGRFVSARPPSQDAREASLHATRSSGEGGVVSSSSRGTATPESGEATEPLLGFPVTTRPRDRTAAAEVSRTPASTQILDRPLPESRIGTLGLAVENNRAQRQQEDGDGRRRNQAQRAAPQNAIPGRPVRSDQSQGASGRGASSSISPGVSSSSSQVVGSSGSKGTEQVAKPRNGGGQERAVNQARGRTQAGESGSGSRGASAGSGPRSVRSKSESPVVARITTDEASARDSQRTGFSSRSAAPFVSASERSRTQSSSLETTDSPQSTAGSESRRGSSMAPSVQSMTR